MLIDKDPVIAKKECDIFLYKFGKIYTEQLIFDTEQTQANYPELEVSQSIDVWAESYANKFKREKVSVFRKVSISTVKSFKLQRFAVLFLCLSISFALVTVISEANNQLMFDFLISDKSIYSEISFKRTDDIINTEDYLSEIPSTWTNFYYLTKLPAGYHFLNTMEGYQSKYIVFSNESDEHMIFAQETLEISAQIDTENAIVKEIKIDGLNGISISKADVTIIAWHDNSNSYILTGNINLKTLVTIAKSKKYIRVLN